MTQSYPLAVNSADVTPANANVGKPRYTGAGATSDWGGSVVGDDPGRPDVVTGLPFSAANVALARSDGSANGADYTPRNQNAKLALVSADGKVQRANIGGDGSVTNPVAAADIGRDRGGIAPAQRYPITGDAALAAPTVASLSPNTAAAAALPVVVTITGTNFTPYSHVHTGGQGNPAQSEKYLSPTQMQVTIQAGTVAGTVAVAVSDHSVKSGSVNFTVT